MKGKNILLAVTSSIAAYKAAALTREYRKSDAEVYVIMTTNATRLIAPLTFSTLSGHPVYTEIFEQQTENSMTHISLADLADITVVAPATANSIGKIATGIGDDLVSTTLLTVLGTIPVLIAPAMNNRMYSNPIVQRNIRILEEIGCYFIGPVEGMLADGRTGMGRMASVEDILRKTSEILEKLTEKK